METAAQISTGLAREISNIACQKVEPAACRDFGITDLDVANFSRKRNFKGQENCLEF